MSGSCANSAVGATAVILRFLLVNAAFLAISARAGQARNYVKFETKATERTARTSYLHAQCFGGQSITRFARVFFVGFLAGRRSRGGSQTLDILVLCYGIFSFAC